MKMIKYIIIAVMICSSVLTFAKPKKGNKVKKATTVSIDFTVDRDGTVRNSNGEVIGKYENGVIIDSEGKALGSKEKTSAEKIGEIYFAD